MAAAGCTGAFSVVMACLCLGVCQGYGFGLSLMLKITYIDRHEVGAQRKQWI